MHLFMYLFVKSYVIFKFNFALFLSYAFPNCSMYVLKKFLINFTNDCNELINYIIHYYT